MGTETKLGCPHCGDEKYDPPRKCANCGASEKGKSWLFHLGNVFFCVIVAVVTGLTFPFLFSALFMGQISQFPALVHASFNVGVAVGLFLPLVIASSRSGSGVTGRGRQWLNALIAMSFAAALSGLLIGIAWPFLGEEALMPQFLALPYIGGLYLASRLSDKKKG